MMPKKNIKQMPFTKDAYFKMLDEMMALPGQPTQTSGNPLIDRLRMAAQKGRMKLAGTAISKI